MDYKTKAFTADMKNSYTILAPNMLPIQFTLLKAAFESEGYARVELLGSSSPEVSRLGLKYVHNDTCYPALIVIGQFLEALNSGKYDLDHVALLISQTGGGCRASNYLKLLKKALVKAGYANVPVLSINPSGLEEGSKIDFTMSLTIKMLIAIQYGDEIMALRNQVAAYEINKGDADRLADKWLKLLDQDIRANRLPKLLSFKKRFEAIAADFAAIPRDKQKRVKVGVVGEIYVKYSPTGNNGLQEFLENQNCEVNMPGLMGFIDYCVADWIIDDKLYGMDHKMAILAKYGLKLLDSVGMKMSKAMRKYGFEAAGSFYDLMKKVDGIVDLGTKMGEGWLLTAEMAELIESGYSNIICAQPFGCLPNHVCGRGVINKLKERYPNANITSIDYDPSATKVNQENRIKLMLAVAKESLDNSKK